MLRQSLVSCFVLILTLSQHGASAQTLADTARSSNSERIFFGRNVEPGQGPWAVHLRIDADDGQTYQCGGAFIDPVVNAGQVVGWRTDNNKPRWVLTAAHCIDLGGKTAKPSQITAYGGSRDIFKLETEGEKQNVVAVIRHNRFNSETLENDIALLVLVSAVKEIPLDRRATIRLPLTSDVEWIEDRYLAVFAQGWGKTEVGRTSPLLKEALLPYVSHDDCLPKFRRFGHHLKYGMICAGFASGGFDSCQGDSGGPLIFRPQGAQFASSRSGVPVLIGVVSWGLGCGNPDLFGIYTSTAYYQSWINGQIEVCLANSSFDKCK
jgi:secreted trypsin-like serine protease